VLTNGDGTNCGACGHSCLGATCSGGSCTPQTLAPPANGSSWGLTLAGTRLYWLSAAGLYSAPTTGWDTTAFGPAATLYEYSTEDIVGFFDTGAAGQQIFASGIDTTSDAGAISTLTMQADGAAPMGFQPLYSNGAWLLDTNGFFWFTGAQVAKRGYKSKLFETIIPNLTGIVTLASDKYNLYAAGGRDVWACPWAAGQCTGTAPTHISATSSPIHLATMPSGTYVYFANSLGIYRCPYLGCTDINAVPIWAGGQQSIGAMAADDTSLYWTDNEVGVVLSCPHSDTVCAAPHVVASGLPGPFGIALDDQYVYFTLSGSTATAAVQRVAK
jgi:hypothetical protein